MSEAIITSRGRITIPADIRRALGLAGGERLIFTHLEDGATIIRAKKHSIGPLKRGSSR